MVLTGTAALETLQELDTIDHVNLEALCQAAVLRILSAEDRIALRAGENYRRPHVHLEPLHESARVRLGVLGRVEKLGQLDVTSTMPLSFT